MLGGHIYWLKILSSNDANVVDTGGTGGCHNDNLRGPPVIEDKAGIMTTPVFQCNIISFNKVK